MKIADRTPFRTEDGKIEIFGRIQGTLKYGLSWYARLQAQDVVIAVLDKTLDPNYVLLRNVTLPDTDIDLPLVLIGPPGVYLINVTHERGVYRAKDDEWGTIAGERFAPASINQIQRTVKLGRVLQIYLDRAGYKGTVIVDTILMAADPGMHIESVRPAVRIVMSDALERFAISMNQARPIFSVGKITELAQLIVKGPKKQPTAAPGSDSSASPLNAGRDTTDELFSSAQQLDSNQTFSADNSASQFQPIPARRAGSTSAPAQSQATFQDSNNRFDDQTNASGDDREDSFQSFADSLQEPGQPRDVERSQADTRSKSTAARSKKTGLFGLTRNQLLILGGILFVWLCGMAAFAIYVYSTL